MHFWTIQNYYSNLRMKIFVNDKPLELISFVKLDPTKRFEHRYQNVDEIPEDVWSHIEYKVKFLRRE
mgnify:CR=1 FL=1